MDATELRQSFEGQVEGQRSRNPEKDRSALRRCASEACCDTRLGGQTFPIDHNQKNVADRGDLTCRESERATARRRRRSEKDERDGGRAGKCGVKRRVRADKALHILANTAMAGSKTSKP